eukprot:4968850-Pyramimonas_sp.AAC.1
MMTSNSSLRSANPRRKHPTDGLDVFAPHAIRQGIPDDWPDLFRLTGAEPNAVSLLLPRAFWDPVVGERGGRGGTAYRARAPL